VLRETMSALVAVTEGSRQPSSAER
jgi:hypothetical protein